MKKLLTILILLTTFLFITSCNENVDNKNINDKNNENTITNEDKKDKEKIENDKKQENEIEKDPIFTHENQFIDIKNSYTYGEKINIILKNVDTNKYNIVYKIKFINSNDFQLLENTTFDFEEKYNHSLIKAEILKNNKVLFTSNEVLIYYKQQPKEYKQLTPEEIKLRNLTNKELAKLIPVMQLRIAIGHNSASYKSSLDFPFPTLEKYNEYEKNKETVIFENNEINDYLNSIYQLTLSQVTMRTRGHQFPRIFEDMNLKGLDKLVNIKELDLSNNTFFKEDLEEIFSKLTKIESLKLNGNSKIKDFSFLRQYNIKELEIKRADLDDSVLENIVTNLPNLEVLNISQNKKLTNLEVLTRLNNLKVLNMDNLNFENLDVLKKLTQLEKLSIVKIQKVDENDNHNVSKLSNLDFLSNLKNLKYLDISDNKVNNFEFLTNLTNLNELRMALVEVSEEGLNSFENIKNLNNLNKLVANQTNLNITNLKLFENLKHLTDLDLSNTLSIIKIEFSKPNISLRFLNLSNTKLDDSETIYSFKNIIELSTKNTPFENKKQDQEYYNSDEVTYFDGKNYIIDHGDHYHLVKVDEGDKNFYRTDIKNHNLLKNKVLIGFTKDGYFLNSIIKKGKYGQNIYNIYYFEGFPDFSFIMPDYKDDSIKYSNELLEYILNKKIEILKTFNLSQEKLEEIKVLKESDKTLIEKINTLNKYYN